ncbi:hypothetical protein G9A89_005093 [Geosiphon pyriformis]|nr:hypothetical protein G9A89_005093 [Geosiphon pyriformis]
MKLLLLSSFGARMVLFLTRRFSNGEKNLIYVVLFLSDVAAVENILKSCEFRLVYNQLSGISASGFSVYTDGSLCSLGSIDMKAGAAAFFEDINLGLEVKVTGVLSNNQADLFAGVSFHSGWLLPFQLKECFVLTNGSIISKNSRHFVRDIFQSIYCASWELGSGAKIVNTLHYKLPIVVYKCLYDKHYSSVVCLYCGNVEVLDHVFSCAFDATAWLQLFIDFAFAWRAISGLSYASSRVLQMLSNCLADLELVALLCKNFVLMDWYQKAAFCFDDSKTVSDRVVEFVHVFGGVLMLLAQMYSVVLVGLSD